MRAFVWGDKTRAQLRGADKVFGTPQCRDSHKGLLSTLVVLLLSACGGSAASRSAPVTVASGKTALTLIRTMSGGAHPFSEPDGIAVDRHDNLYVANSGNNQIDKFNSQGKLVTEWGSPGRGDGQFSCNFCAIAVDGRGDVYVTDPGNSRVQKFNSSGKFLTKWGSSGTRDGQFYSPFGIAVDQQGDVYVGDTGNARVEKFDSNGKFLAKWGRSGSGNGQFPSDLADLAVDTQENIFVTDRSNGIQKSTARCTSSPSCRAVATADAFRQPQAWQWMRRAASTSLICRTIAFASSTPLAAF
jgi:DNA-binding beta-propeller fold protein YncE